MGFFALMPSQLHGLYRWGSVFEPQSGLAPESALSLLPSRDFPPLRSLIVYSQMAEEFNRGTKKKLDVRSAFRHVYCQGSELGAFGLFLLPGGLPRFLI
jgi:hypothetical protein